MDRLDQLIESYRDEMVTTLQGLVRIPSVKGEAKPGKPFGDGPADCLKAALELAEKFGMKSTNVDNYAGHAEIGDGDQTMAILVHLDVVPVGEKWTKPPFDAIIEDGRIWGRGASDNKAACVETFFAIRALQEIGMPWKKKVRMIFGCDEESGWEDMKYYKQHMKMPDFGYVPDGSFPLTNAEKGIFHFELKIPGTGDDLKILDLVGGERPNVVLARSTMKLEGAFSTKDCPEAITITSDGNVTTLVSEGVAAHGSTPENGKNAGYQLLNYLKEQGWKGNLVDCVTDIFGDLRGEAAGVKFEDEASGHLSMNLGALNKVGNDFVAVVDIRYPVTMDYDFLLNTLKAKAAQYHAELTVMDHKLPLYLPKDHPLVTTLLRVYEETTGQHGEAESTGGGTYARAMSNAVAYGPGFRDPYVDHHCHNADEFVIIDELIRACKVYAHTIMALQDVTI